MQVEEWLFWQVGGVGPMAGQAHHFLRYAPAMEPPQDLPYAKDRYRDEVARLYGVLDRRLAGRELRRRRLFDRRHGDLALGDAAGRTSSRTSRRFPNMAAWLERVGSRPAVAAGAAVATDRALAT